MMPITTDLGTNEAIVIANMVLISRIIIVDVINIPEEFNCIECGECCVENGCG